MSDWQPNQYLKFKDDRTQPSIDLVNRIEVDSPKRIIDIGCGPGNSTKILKDRWPEAEIIGLDNSAAMIEKAQTTDPDIDWVLMDSNADLSSFGKFDIIFSNAALQWMPGHEVLIPKLFDMLNEGGAIAIQVPYVKHLPIFAEILNLTKNEKWSAYFQAPPEYPKHFAFPYFYAIISPLSESLKAWQTDYITILDSHEGIVEWYKGTALRPFLNMLPDEALQAEFCNDYLEKVVEAYPVEKNGKILLPFTRVFFTLYRIQNL